MSLEEFSCIGRVRGEVSLTELRLYWRLVEWWLVKEKEGIMANWW